MVIDWNAAFVYEPSGSRDIPDILEIANAQLLELRYYDDALDHSLARVNQRLKRERRRLGSIFRSPYPALSRQVLVTLLEMSELVERVENSLKHHQRLLPGPGLRGGGGAAAHPGLEGDGHPEAGDPRADVYGWLKGEVDTARSLTLEVMIVLLIVVELLVALGSVSAGEVVRQRPCWWPGRVDPRGTSR